MDDMLLMKPYSKMRRLLAAACACLLACLPAAALAAPGDATLFAQTVLLDHDQLAWYKEGNLDQAVQLDGAFYLRTWEENALLRWAPGMIEPEAFCTLPPRADESLESAPFELTDPAQIEALSNDIALIAAGDGKLWAFNAYAGRIGEITAQGVTWRDVQLDTADLFRVEAYEDGQFGYLRTLTHPIVAEGVFYCLRDTYAEDSWSNRRTLMCWDIATGALRQIETGCAQMICPYKPGQFLTFGTDFDESAGEPVSAMTVLDLASGKETPLDFEKLQNAYALSGLAYDAATDSVYYTLGRRVWRWVPGAPAVLAAYIPAPEGMTDATAWLLPGGLYAIAADGLYVRSADPQQAAAARSLTIANGWEDTVALGFMAEHPDVPLLFNGDAPVTAEGIAQAIASGDGQTDIFVLYSMAELRALIGKGLAADLSGAEALAQDVAAMYPQVQKALCDSQGRPMAYPRGFDLSPWSVNQTLWDRFNLGPLPTTYAQFFDCMARWQAQYAEANPHVRFLSAAYDSASLTELVLNDYILQYGRPGEPIDFTAPVLRDALAQIAALNLQPAPEEAWYADEFSDGYEAETQVICHMTAARGLFYNADQTQYLTGTDPESAPVVEALLVPPMVFEAGQKPRVYGQMQVIIVNPSSKNLDMAIQYAAYCARYGLDLETRYALHPGMNEPAEKPGFEDEVRFMQAWRNDAAQALESPELTDEEKGYMRESLDYVARWLAEQDNNRWLVAAKPIAAYRAIAEDMTFAEDLPLLNQAAGYGEALGPQEKLQDLIDRYTGGELGLDALLQQLNSELR
ncbi:MAG: hypothetical protein LBU67_06850 [Oscillospiraceae bacterium]|jgi:ABC-type glycerol-3-phosphate transport system substrate-binding protein|nr:hypothetical protein [Oscillospiraceae bacterium]